MRQGISNPAANERAGVGGAGQGQKQYLRGRVYHAVSYFMYILLAWPSFVPRCVAGEM